MQRRPPRSTGTAKALGNDARASGVLPEEDFTCKDELKSVDNAGAAGQD